MTDAGEIYPHVGKGKGLYGIDFTLTHPTPPCLGSFVVVGDLSAFFLHSTPSTDAVCLCILYPGQNVIRDFKYGENILPCVQMTHPIFPDGKI